MMKCALMSMSERNSANVEYPPYARRGAALAAMGVFALSGCSSVEEAFSVPPAVEGGISPSPEAGESEYELPQSEISDGEPTGLEQWAQEVLDTVGDCEEGVDVSRHWSGMPHDMVVVSGCSKSGEYERGDRYAELHDTAEDAEQGTEPRMFANEAEQLMITDGVDDDSRYLKVEHFTITDIGAIETSGVQFVIAREDVVTMR